MSIEILTQQKKLDLGPVVGIDIETIGLHPMDGAIRLIAVSDSQKTYVWDVYQLGFQPLCDLGERVWVAHNMQFEYRWFLQKGLPLSGELRCTMLRQKHKYLDNDRVTSFSLAGCMKREFNVDRLDKELQKSDFSGHITEAQFLYCAQDALDTFHLESVTECTDPRSLHQDEALIPIVARMELIGLKMDLNVTRALVNEFKLKLKRNLAEIQSLLPPLSLDLRDSNGKRVFGSQYWTATGKPTKYARENYPDGYLLPHTRAHFLLAFQQLGVELPTIYDVKKGKHRVSLSKDTYGKIDHPAGLLIGEYYKDEKLLTSYLEPVLPESKGGGWVKQDGLVHPTISIFGTVTGRFTFTSPALQTLPKGDKRIRQNVLAPPGYKILKVDYSQIEPRILADYTKDPALTRIYQNGERVYTFTAQALFGLTPKKGSDEDQLAKNIYLGSQYDQGVNGLKSYIWRNAKMDIPIEQCREFRSTIKRTFTGLAQYHTRVRKITEANYPDGYVDCTSYLGRTKRFKVGNLPAKRRDDGSYWVHCSDIINYKIQATGSDVLKQAMIDLANDPILKDVLWNEVLYLILQVHDELVFLIREDRLGLVPHICDVMTRAGKKIIVDIPIAVEASWGNSWGDVEGEYAHETK